MLVFRRTRGESFRVGENIEVRILDTGKGYVKVGVIAPDDVSIRRTEIEALNRQAVVADWREPAGRARLEELARRLKKS